MRKPAFPTPAAPLLAAGLLLSAWSLAAVRPAAEAAQAALFEPRPSLRGLATRPLAELARSTATSVPAQPQPVPGAAVQALGDGRWQLDTRQRLRAELLRELAARSGSRLSGPLPGGAAAPGVWQADSLSQAWGLLLGAGVSHLIQCGPRHCEVRLLAPVGQAAPTNPANPSPGAAGGDPPGLFPSA